MQVISKNQQRAYSDDFVRCVQAFEHTQSFHYPNNVDSLNGSLIHKVSDISSSPATNREESLFG